MARNMPRERWVNARSGGEGGGEREIIEGKGGGGKKWE